MAYVSTSILSITQSENFVKEIYSIEVAGTDYVHIDVMDNIFVPNKTHMLPLATIVKQVSNLPLDVHFMTKDVKAYIDMFLPLEPSIITFHLEAIENVQEIIDYIKENNIKVRFIYKTQYKNRRPLSLLR